jgi:hypothetical protein
MNILEDFLTEIADAIRKRKAKTGLIEAQQFAEEIESIPQDITGLFQEKTVELTSSELSITPDSNYDALSKVTVTPKLQSKTQTVTTNTTTTIKPDTGYVGLSSVAVTTNVVSADPINNVRINYDLDKKGTFTVTLAGTVKKALVTFVLVYNSGGASAGSGYPRCVASKGTVTAKSTPTYTDNFVSTRPWTWNFTNTTGSSSTLTLDVDWEADSSFCHIHSYAQVSY